ncbi:hypothetical protein [Litorisediminicola beolgyonensis]|uniref:DUF4177 domain-containing protein n=1 Tax=Litorisediminicola beolgyonensis TaxID=1173614 RepID=A0ABW3ZHG0_9RHOB
MASYEYKVLPAPAKGEKAKGVRGAEGRFAFAIEHLMNDMASEGWEYLRAETLPSEERSGLTSSITVWRTVLVFRRAKAGSLSEFEPRLLAAPERGSGRTAAVGAAAPVRDASPDDAPAEPAPSFLKTSSDSAKDVDDEDAAAGSDAPSSTPTEESSDGEADQTPDPDDQAPSLQSSDDGPPEERTPDESPAPRSAGDNGVEGTELVRDLSSILKARAAARKDSAAGQ